MYVDVNNPPAPPQKPPLKERVGAWWDRQVQQGLTVCVSRLIEVATIVGLFLAFWWIGLVLLFGDFTPRRLRAVEVVQLVGQNWAAIMLVTLLLFGRAVRMFLERLKSAFGVEAVHPADDQPEPTQNPKTKDGGLQ